MKSDAVTRIISLEENASLIKQFFFIVIFSLLTVVGGWILIPLPFSPVPITMQTFFVILAGAMLGAKRGALSQSVFLFYGICGLPVFAGGTGTIAILGGPTGGYLLGFPIAAFVTGLLVSENNNILKNLGAFLIGSLPVLILGTIQLSLYTGQSLQNSLAIGALPFLAGDFIKCAAAAAVVSAVKKYQD